MKYSMRPLIVLSLCSLSLSAIAGDMCLLRERDPKAERIMITDFQQPNAGTIFINYSNTDSVCRNTLCDIQSGDVLHINRNSIWKQNGGEDIKFIVENVGGTDEVPLYMKLHLENNPRFVYYLMQAQNNIGCFNGKAEVSCKAYIFEAFDLDNMGDYILPENGEFLDTCTDEGQPGTGGGAEPPPRPK